MLMTKNAQWPADAPPALTRETLDVMLAHLSREIGAPLRLGEDNSVALSYHDDQEATLFLVESCGMLLLTAPVADPSAIELSRLRELLELNMDWTQPYAICVPRKGAHAHVAAILPVDPNDPASLERWLAKTIIYAGETSCAANVIDLPAPATPAANALA